MYYVIQCRFSEFLFQLCIKNAFFLGPCRNITTMCRKIAFFLGPCRNITIQGHQGQGVPGVPCRAIFSGREEILIFGEIFTSVSPSKMNSLLRLFLPDEYLVKVAPSCNH